MCSKEVQLNKLFIVPTSTNIETFYGNHPVYEYRKETIGWFDSNDAAEENLIRNVKSEHSVFAYEIVGPEHGFGKSDWIFNEKDGLIDEIRENEVYDESPEFQFIYNSHKKLISSYFYDKNNPGGERLNEEIKFQEGDRAFTMISVNIGNDDHNLLIPVKIKGMVTKKYLEKKWREVIWDLDKKTIGESAVPAPSKERIKNQIDSLLNIEQDSVIFKPLVNVKSNWGEEPSRPVGDCPRINILPYDIITDTGLKDLFKKLRERMNDRISALGNQFKIIPSGGNSKDSQSSYRIEIKHDNLSISNTLYKIFKPTDDIKIWHDLFKMAISGDGNEKYRITTLHSSSLLALLFFCNVSEKNPIRINGDEYVQVFFEVKNKVFKNAPQNDKPSNVDILLVSKGNKRKILFLESKFTEYNHNGKVELAEKYHKFYNTLVSRDLDLKFENGLLETSDSKNNQYLYGIKQMFSHIIGALTSPDPANSIKLNDLIENAEQIEVGSILFNWNWKLFNKYNKFYGRIFKDIDFIKECLQNSDINIGKIKKLSVIPRLFSYQEIVKENPSYEISDPIKAFYNL